MKKSYSKPEFLVVNIELSRSLCTVSTNVGVEFPGGGNGEGRAADYRMRGSDWDEYFN